MGRTLFLMPPAYSSGLGQIPSIKKTPKCNSHLKWVEHHIIPDTGKIDYNASNNTNIMSVIIYCSLQLCVVNVLCISDIVPFLTIS